MISQKLKPQSPRVLKEGVLITIIIVFLLSGCYTFSGSGLPKHIKTVSIPFFDNQTTEIGLGEDLRDETVQAILDHNVLKLAEEEGDAILEIDIMEYLHGPHTYDNTGQVKEYKVVIKAAFRFTDAKKDEVLWEDVRSFLGIYNYVTETEADGLKLAKDQFQETILDNTISSW
jgi:outer membrane lipopolysaccharide assembly protein LptE/RlpB